MSKNHEAEAASTEKGSEAAQGFPAGKTAPLAEVTDADPRNIARRFLDHRAASVKEEVSGDIALTKGLTAIRRDKTKVQQLMKMLAEAKVLSKEEARLGPDIKKSRTSMFTKIAQHADVLLDEKILPYLQPGYTVLYQVALLYEELEAANERD